MRNENNPEQSMYVVKLPGSKDFDMVYILTTLEKSFNSLPFIIEMKEFYCNHLIQGMLDTSMVYSKSPFLVRVLTTICLKPSVFGS